MRWRHRLWSLAIVLALLIVCIPLTLAMALLSLPLLRWFEAEYAIEAIGHSGPAEWVLYSLYGTLVSVSGLLWRYCRKPH